MAKPIELRPVNFGVRDWPLRAKKKSKSAVFSRKPQANTAESNENKNIAAIDFGTTHCSLAYTTESSDNIASLILNEVFPRVPTAILLYKEGFEISGNENKGIRCKVQAFGFNAQTQYQRIRLNDRSKYVYFERMKMRLQHDQKVDRTMKIKAHDSSEWYLIEVISLILQHLKDELERNLQMCEPGLDGTRLKATDFDWVITVPAIWQARGKGMMREAGNMAGLYDVNNRITYLSRIEIGVQQSNESVSSKLSLVPEPEAAAFYCRQMKVHDLSEHCKEELANTNLAVDQYIVIDVGGGTVDVTVQRQDAQTGKIEITQNPEGNDCGGVKVNQEFAKLVQKVLGEEVTNSIYDLDTAFPRLLSGEDCEILKPALNFLLYNEFEHQKEMFGSTAASHQSMGDAEITVKLPDKIVRKCTLSKIDKNVKKLNDKLVEVEDDVLYIKYARVKDFFLPSLNGILGCTKKILLTAMLKSDTINTIFLVGGFGGSRYIYSHIEHMINSEFPKANFVIAVPHDHKMAVSHGAVLYKKTPIIQSRCMNRTYGLAVTVPFDPSIHDENYVYYNEDGQMSCTGCFLTFVQSGDPVKADEVFVFDILSDVDDSRVITFPFYCSEELSLKYLYDYRSPTLQIPLAHKVGELQFVLSENDILHKHQRTFTVILDFSSAEIHATVRYCTTGEDIRTKLDFLC